ncbi:MAG: Uma2 family endonuclease, partial [Proteobacteria bacterium]|nr:Uma2 family endonuclease [Pseudomonadota bacterium]
MAPANAIVATKTEDGALPAHLRRRHALAELIREDGSIDWSPWYLTEEEDMGQSGQQGEIIEVMMSSLKVLASERDWHSVLIAADNFFAWVEDAPLVQVSPDIYLLDDPPPESEELPRRWELWRHPTHKQPRFVLEIVSADWQKDYRLNPPKYDHMGVGELVIADPDAFCKDLSDRGRAAFTVYRRTPSDRLELVYRGQGPAYCAAIDAYLCFVWQSKGRARVRISRDRMGQDIVATGWELVRAAKKEAQDARKDAQDARKDAQDAR